MATCLPCGHIVSDEKAPQWSYKSVTFYFCAPGCEVEVKADPEKWLALAKSSVHGHGHAQVSQSPD